jgi:hypothetical protein
MTEAPHQPGRDNPERDESPVLAQETLKDLDPTDEQTAQVKGGTGSEGGCPGGPTHLQ